MEDYDWISDILSGIAIIIALYSLLYTRRYQSFDYKPRLQILDEFIQSSIKSGANTYLRYDRLMPTGVSVNNETDPKESPPVFSYRAKLVNVSDKPVQIVKILMHYGDESDKKKQVNFVLDGQSYLQGGSDRQIEFKLEDFELDAFREAVGIDECFFTLHIKYYDASGKVVEAYRSLGGTKTVMVQAGVILNPVRKSTWWQSLSKWQGSLFKRYH